MADNENTTPAGVTTKATELNTILVNFIKNHGEAVRYIRTSDGKSLITIEYGKYRVPDMDKIKEFINTTIYDELLKIDQIPVVCVKVTDSVIVFSGTTTTVDAYLKTNVSKSAIAEIVAKAKVVGTSDQELIESLGDDVVEVLQLFVSEKSSVLLETAKKIGYSYEEKIEKGKENGTGFVGFDVKKVNDFITTNGITTAVEVGDSVKGIKKDFNKVLKLSKLIRNLRTYKVNFTKAFDDYIHSDAFKTAVKGEIVTLSDTRLVISFDINEYKETFDAEEPSEEPTYISVDEAGFVALTAEQITAGIPEENPPVYYVLKDGVTEETIQSAEDFEVVEITEFAENVTYYVVKSE